LNNLIVKNLSIRTDRYKQIFDADSLLAQSMAFQYYSMAAAGAPAMGMAHNQLGYVRKMHAHGVHAIYHYLRWFVTSFVFNFVLYNFLFLQHHLCPSGQEWRVEFARIDKIDWKRN
jgi:hypothetical protein